MRIGAAGRRLVPSSGGAVCTGMDGCPATDTTATDWAPSCRAGALPSLACGWPMERAMFELIPTLRGWCLDRGDHRGHWFADRDVAIAAAERSAELRHRLGQRPTGCDCRSRTNGCCWRATAEDQRSINSPPGMNCQVRTTLRMSGFSRFWAAARTAPPAWRCARPRRRGAGCRWTGRCRRVPRCRRGGCRR